MRGKFLEPHPDRSLARQHQGGSNHSIQNHVREGKACSRRRRPPEREVPTMNAGHGMQPGPSSSQKALNQQQYGYPQSSQMVSVGSSQGMLTGNQFPPAYPQIAVPRIHYGPFPGPAKTVYPWTYHPTAP
ncbi:hypothetical protein C8R43DRAFT_945744 [Mycena crocata]|nr:hypothetical protein C8R43DRAFT_945744 [Mycena crocata]